MAATAKAGASLRRYSDPDPLACLRALRVLLEPTTNEDAAGDQPAADEQEVSRGGGVKYCSR